MKRVPVFLAFAPLVFLLNCENLPSNLYDKTRVRIELSKPIQKVRDGMLKDFSKSAYETVRPTIAKLKIGTPMTPAQLTANIKVKRHALTGGPLNVRETSMISDSVFRRLKSAPGYLGFAAKIRTDKGLFYFGYLDGYRVVIRDFIRIENNRITENKAIPERTENLPKVPLPLLMHEPLVPSQLRGGLSGAKERFTARFSDEPMYRLTKNRLRFLKTGDSAFALYALLEIQFTDAENVGRIRKVMPSFLKQHSSVNRVKQEVVLGFGVRSGNREICKTKVLIKKGLVREISACKTSRR